jgi:hypothetical protein
MLILTPIYEISGACGLARFAEANRDKGQCVHCIGLLGDASTVLFDDNVGKIGSLLGVLDCHVY